MCGLDVRPLITKSGPRQRLLGEFMLGNLRPVVMATTSTPSVLNLESSAARMESVDGSCPLNQQLPLGPPVSGSGSQNPAIRSGLQNSRTYSTVDCPPPTLAEWVDMTRPVVLQPVLSGITAWKPGTLGLYARPRGAQDPGSWPTALPIWKVRVDGLKPMEAMFQFADNITQSALYIAADDWTRKAGKEWSVGKRFGAFNSAAEFVTNFLEISSNRCFYEIIRKDRPCKAYFDLEAEAGAMKDVSCGMQLFVSGGHVWNFAGQRMGSRVLADSHI